MSTYTSTLHQIVFSTKNRIPCLTGEIRTDLINYLWTICANKNCVPYAINGTEDHLHILLDIHPAIAVSDLVKAIKTSSSRMLKEQKIFGFPGWQLGYGHFTYSIDAKEALKKYISAQQEHHKKYSSKEELIMLLKRRGIDYDPKYLL